MAKMSRRQLREIINEEIQRSLSEGLIDKAKSWIKRKEKCDTIGPKGDELVKQMITASEQLSSRGSWSAEDLKKYREGWASNPCLNRRQVKDMQAGLDRIIAKLSN
tara:strand:- start:157 stop:474 length:318 start_codon:yes stop_codon:yes gene_type:complete